MKVGGLLLVGLLLLGSAAAWYYFREQGAVTVTTLACADITQGCGNREFQVRFDRHPQIMQPFRLSLTAPYAAEAHASFVMQSMDMGFNRYRLLRQPDGTWSAEVTLPVCMRGRSDWLMELDIAEPAGRAHYRIPFSTR